MVQMDDIKKTIEKGVSIAKEGVTYAAARAEDLSLAAALRLRIFARRRRIERLCAELGEKTYKLSLAKADVGADAAVKKHVKKIAALEREVDGLFKELEKFSRKSGGARGRPAKKKPTRKGPKKARASSR
ncbi:MAG TPA: hypothetical protein VMX79_05150 [bacterium]|nr:hypothetical protein [bacterium]